jgi:hypothetical protein
MRIQELDRITRRGRRSDCPAEETRGADRRNGVVETPMTDVAGIINLVHHFCEPPDGAVDAEAENPILWGSEECQVWKRDIFK